MIFHDVSHLLGSAVRIVWPLWPKLCARARLSADSSNCPADGEHVATCPWQLHNCKTKNAQKSDVWPGKKACKGTKGSDGSAVAIFEAHSALPHFAWHFSGWLKVVRWWVLCGVEASRWATVAMAAMPTQRLGTLSLTCFRRFEAVESVSKSIYTITIYTKENHVETSNTLFTSKTK